MKATFKGFLKKTATLSLTCSMLALPLAISTNVQAAGERFVLISHADDADSWWNTIKTALREASEQLDVKTEYRNPPTGDLADMARIVEQVIASNPDGIILPITDFDVLSGPVAKARKKGIPIITINSGSHEQSEKWGALLHVGQPEYAAGNGAGKRAKAAGVKSFVCVNHYIENPSSVERCQGFADALGVKLKGSMIDVGKDPTDIEKKVLAYLRINAQTDAILTLGPTSAHPTLRALEKNHKSGEIYFGTFDLSGEIAKGVKAGVISFAIDQQPYLQGYMPVSILTNYVRYGVVPGNHINSGPGFITKENIEKVEKLAGEYR
ncbi:MAG: simple sugar transport system substrate-binding protein [Oceanospirillaceae bacterium]|jgi:simple sugar transport system substrate-binding protein